MEAGRPLDRSPCPAPQPFGEKLDKEKEMPVIHGSVSEKNQTNSDELHILGG